MKKNYSHKLDLTNTALNALSFILVLTFSFINLQEKPSSFFFVFLVIVGSLIGYYLGMTVAILYSIFFVFLYGSLNIYNNFTAGIPVGWEVYYWLLIIPVFSFVSAYYGGLLRGIQEENNRLNEAKDKYMTIDQETGLMSSQSFFNELQAYMRIHERYGIEVYLLVIKLKYENEVISILGESKFKEMVKKISDAITQALRDEDRKYILRDVNMFACILLSNKNGDKYVKPRLREAITAIEFTDDPTLNRLKLEVQMGLATYDKEKIKSPYEFYRISERDLEYDV